MLTIEPCDFERTSHTGENLFKKNFFGVGQLYTPRCTNEKRKNAVT